jgi:transposase
METPSYEELLALVQELQAQIIRLTEENAALRAEIERLKSTPSPPSWVKPSRPQPTEAKPPRKKRPLDFSRKREAPTKIIEHRLERCPDCGGPVSQGFEKRRRQVIEIPECAVEITDHVFFGHYCGYCQKQPVAFVSSAEIGAVGGGRLGVRLRSLVCLLRTEGRLPFRTIRTLLKVQYRLHVSVGEIVEIVHSTAQAGKQEVEAILYQLLAAPVVQADETSWREDGQNGWLWGFSTPESPETPIRYYHYDPSRGKTVVEALLGETFGGVLVSDFYAAYAVYLGRHQRCWVHFLRDLHELRQKHPEDPSVAEWTQAVKQVYERAKAWKPPRPKTRFEERDRHHAQNQFEAELRDLAAPYLSQEAAPQRVLAERIEKFLPELFVFIVDPRVPSDNNGAERSLRPSVIARKISGGTRSEKGSQTRTLLMTLFATWKLQGKDLLETCRQLLLSSSPLPSPSV